MRATKLPYAIILNTEYDGQGLYCGLSTASEVFLIFTTQIYLCLCKYNATVFKSFLTRGK